MILPSAIGRWKEQNTARPTIADSHATDVDHPTHHYMKQETTIHQACQDWLETAGSRLAIGVRVTASAPQSGTHGAAEGVTPAGRAPAAQPQTEDRIVLSLDGINPAIAAFLTDHELEVIVDWEGQNWDRLLSLDVIPLRLEHGYVCDCCKPEVRTVFPTLDVLWRDHLFEPFLDWVNKELAVAATLGLYGSPSDGFTYAKLLPKNKQEVEPDICLPVRERERG